MSNAANKTVNIQTLSVNARNRYRNPWAKILNVPKPEFYENNARVIFTFRGVSVYKLGEQSFDYVFSGCCITQRAGFNEANARKIISDILDGNDPVAQPVADHLKRNGCKPLSYEQYHQDYLKGLRA
jgi:hypothetical protein